MNRRKKIYRGFSRRNKSSEKFLVITVSLIVICVIGGYSYIKLKDIRIVDKIMDNKIITYVTSKISNRGKSDSGFITADDISKELEEITDNSKEDLKKDDSSSANIDGEEDIKLAKTEGWRFYTIQVASVNDDKDLEKFKSDLNNNKIPCSVVEVDNTKKVQTYSSFDEEYTRAYLDEVKKVYPDAFISEMKIPMLSLEYTSKYEYVGNISNQLNKLITNFEEESSFWKKNEQTLNKEEYNKILTNRSEIIKSIETEVGKIDYEGMKVFKENLQKYVNEINDRITQSSKAVNEEQYHIAMSNFVSCMQGYYSFINIIKSI
ncbi:MAG: hypothetical protein ACRC3Y_17775 [Romboutsia sp.]|uniref:hypothetical protein n=1 Tax=Romboutsia sp. TaxID=1965302 RepID=UPI003F2DECAE